MANVGTAASGKTLIGSGNGVSPTFASIGTNSGLTAHAVVLSEGNGAFVATNAGTNGQVLLGANSADAAFANLTSSNGSIAFTLGPNALDLVTTNFDVWIDISGTANIVVKNYFVTGASTLTLPNGAQGQVVRIICDTASAVTLQARTGDAIRIATSISSTSGTITSSAIGDSVTIVYRASDKVWIANNSVGNWGFA